MTTPESHRIEKDDVLGHSLSSILSDTSSPEHGLASGSAAALTVSLAAALLGSAARELGSGEDSSGLLIQSENLRLRAVELVDRNTEHFDAARSALEARKEDPGYRDHRIGEAMKDSLETLRLIAGAGADTAELAAAIAEISDEQSVPEAVSAAILAESGVRVATALMETNLISRPDGELMESARADALAATASSRRAYGHLG